MTQSPAQKILKILSEREKVKTRELAKELDFSRQYVHSVLKSLIEEGKIIRIGATNTATYYEPAYVKSHLKEFNISASKTFKNINLEEHKVADGIESQMPLLAILPESLRSIFQYGFSEMLNNAIEHSDSASILIRVGTRSGKLYFEVIDYGIGVFNNIQKKKHLETPIAAIQDLLKGKLTTQPHAHSGEGIFFTSKAADYFILDSFGVKLLIDTLKDDVAIRSNKSRVGTRVFFEISLSSDRHLDDVFKKYTDPNTEDGYGFNKTEVKIKLYTMGGVHISRSQARRVLVNLDKFESIVLDYENVPMVGQAFADEIYRVFKSRHPEIKLQTINANDPVKFMIQRAEGGGATLFGSIRE
jgi:predicted transcriptional regulator/anti-sigma regulatory factor (Ser/Thr protein kinase)